METKRTKEQIVAAYENNIVLKVIGWAALVGGIVLIFILPGRSGQTLTTIILGLSFLIAMILLAVANLCPVCGGMKSPTYFVAGFIRMRRSSFRCDRCNLSNPQVREYIDLLKRGVDIDKNVIARFNRGDL